MFARRLAGGLLGRRPFSDEGATVDASQLYRVSDDVKRGSAFHEGKCEAETPLGRFLRDQIEVRGPLTISNYMRECLCNAKWGYYTQAEQVFGSGGDFVTAPEISQMFGECFGVWAIGAWRQMGEPRSLELVEMGPGNGTLMADVLRTVRQLCPPFFAALQAVRFVEISDKLRERQRAAVCGAQLIDETRVSWHRHIEELIYDDDDDDDDDKGRADTTSSRQNSEAAPTTLTTRGGEQRQRAVRRVRAGPPVIMIGQEFLDALPVHQFEYRERGWSERLVNIDDENKTPYYFNFVLSPSETIATRAWASHIKTAKLGDCLEFCPEALVAGEHIARLLAERHGVCAFVDYGHNGDRGLTLRGIRDHQFVHPLSTPGRIDLTVDVNFRALAQHVRNCALPGFAASPVDVYGAIEQRTFLQQLGIDARFVKLLKNADSRQAAQLIASYRRLIDADQMGSLYKVLAIYNRSSFKNQLPVGFS